MQHASPYTSTVVATSGRPREQAAGSAEKLYVSCDFDQAELGGAYVSSLERQVAGLEQELAVARVQVIKIGR
jgi:hypothetical protein